MIEMHMWWLDFVVLALASGALVNAWLKEDGLFSELRLEIAIWGEPTTAEQDKPTWWSWVRNKTATLAGCEFCLTYHAAFWLMVLCYLPRFFIIWPWDHIIFLPVYILAAARLSTDLADIVAVISDVDD